MANEKKKLFAFGALAYPAIELLWRKKTHPTMALAGGLGMLILDAIDLKMWRKAVKYTVGCVGITALELALGLIINKKHKIWDYSKKKGNLAGQICPAFCAAWLLLCLPGYAVCRRLRTEKSLHGPH